MMVSKAAQNRSDVKGVMKQAAGICVTDKITPECLWLEHLLQQHLYQV